MRNCSFLQSLWITGWLFLPLALLGSGTRVDYVDAFATGRGNAFSATADNPSAVYYNPAGITQLEGTQAQVGSYFIALDYEVEIGGQTYAMDDEIQPLPSLFVTTEIPQWKGLSAGLGLYAPFGLATDWPDNSPFFTVADRSELRYLTVHPVLAYQVSDTLSIGGGPTFNFANLEFQQNLTGFRYEGDDQSTGFVASLLWTPRAEHSFALLYRSEATSDFSGNLQLPVGPGNVVPTTGEASFAFPEIWRVGYSYQPDEQWNLEVNMEWMDWEALNTVVLQNPVAPVPFVFEWDSSWFYEFGMTRFFAGGNHFSLGYVWVENSIPDATFTPIVPDTNRHFFSLGWGHRGDRWSWDVVGQYGLGDRDFAAVPGVPGGSDFFGNYQTNSLAINASLAYRF